MTEEELQNIKEENKKNLVDSVKKKDDLEKEFIVTLYLKELDFIKRQEAYQEFLSKLQIGVDGTVFSFYDKNKDNAFKNTFYHLSTVLAYAFYLKTTLLDKDFKDIEITFDELSQYIDKANQILTNMNFFPGDRKIPNEYGLEIYENPMNYSLIDFKKIMPYLTEDVLNKSYNVSFLELKDKKFRMNSNDMEFFKINLEYFTPREYEAFFGNDAILSLGGVPTNTKVKTYEKVNK